VKLFRKNSNLCDRNPPTLQTDRRHAIARPRFALSASRGKKTNNTKYSKTKLAWFNRLLRHSARKRVWLILQLPSPHGARQTDRQRQTNRYCHDITVLAGASKITVTALCLTANITRKKQNAERAALLASQCRSCDLVCM